MNITGRKVLTQKLLDYLANLEAQVTARSRELIQAEKLAFLGYARSATFYSAFKSIFGITPSQLMDSPMEAAN